MSFFFRFESSGLRVVLARDSTGNQNRGFAFVFNSHEELGLLGATEFVEVKIFFWFCFMFFVLVLVLFCFLFVFLLLFVLFRVFLFVLFVFCFVSFCFDLI